MNMNNMITLKLSINDGAGTDVNKLVEAENQIAIEDGTESFVMVKISKHNGKFIISTQSFDSKQNS